MLLHNYGPGTQPTLEKLTYKVTLLLEVEE